MKKITIANQKGGVAKTTTTVNVAGALALRDKKILIIDEDPQANASCHFEHSSHHTIQDIFLERECIPAKTSTKNIDIIPANRELSGVSHLLTTDIDKQFLLRDYINTLEGYDYVLIDTPPTLGSLTTSAFIASNYVLIPISTNYLTMKGVDDLMETIFKIKARLNPELQILGICFTIHDRRTVLAGEIIEQAKQSFNGKCFSTVIGKSVKVEEAQIGRAPVVNLYPTSTTAKEFIALAEEIVGVLS